MNRSMITLLTVAILGCGAPAALGQNIDLSTVPRRATVQLTIYNSEDITLVRETRVVTASLLLPTEV